MVLGKKLGRKYTKEWIYDDNKINYIHWDDPNEIVDRLRLLEILRQTDHNDNEILSIIEELREAGLIIN